MDFTVTGSVEPKFCGATVPSTRPAVGDGEAEGRGVALAVTDTAGDAAAEMADAEGWAAVGEVAVVSGGADAVGWIATAG